MQTVSQQLSELGALTRLRCVPLVVLTDTSHFGSQCEEQLRRLCDERFAPITFFGKSDATAQTIMSLRKPGLRQRAESAGLEVWEQPPWVCWFLSGDMTTPDTLHTGLDALPFKALGAADLHLQHFVLLSLSAEEAIADTLESWRQVVRGRANIRLFWLFEDRSADLTAESLASGAVGFAFGGWRRYCETNESQLSTGLFSTSFQDDSTDGNDVQISPSVCRPDLNWHSELWAQGLASETLSLWLRERPAHSELPAMSMEELVATPANDGVLNAEGLITYLLPERRGDSGYWLSSPDIKGEAHELVLLEKRFSFNHHEQALPVHRKWYSLAREKLAQEFTRIKNRHYARQLFTLVSAEKWISGSQTKLSDFLAARLRLRLTIPNKPDGLLAELKERLNQFDNYAAGVEAIQSQPGKKLDTFEADAKDSLRRISGIPAITSPILRLMLLLAAFVGLAAASAEARGTALVEILFSSFGIVIAFAFAGLASLVLFHFLVVEWLAVRSLRRLDSNSIMRHCHAVGDVIARTLHEIGRDLREQVATWVAQRDALRRDLAGLQTEQPVEIAAQANREPFFSESASRRLLTTSRRKKLLEEIHARWLLAIGDLPFPAFDATAWLNTLHRVAREASSEHLNQITLQEWLDAESPSAQKIAERLKNLVRESRSGIHAPPTVCFVPENWATHRGVNDMVQIYDAGLSQLLVVSLLPPP
jgi:hypothetical protein